MIHIAFNIDENYIEQCEFVIASILYNTKEKCHFHIVGLSGYESDELVSFYPAPDTSNFSVDSGYITKATLYRLFYPEIIHVDKVIHLDCDLIVRDDIKKLWKYNPKEIAGCVDCCPQVRFTDKYINAGVMVMNLKNIRNSNYMERFIKAKEKARTRFGDQDLINLALNIENIPQKWNISAHNFPFQSKECFNKERSSILHYNGKLKPWKYDCDNYEYYRQYQRLLNNWQKSLCK